MVAATYTTRMVLVAAGSAAGGAVLTYLCDPDRGRARRAQLTDQAAAALRRGRRRAGTRLRYSKGRLVGAGRAAVGGGHLTPEDDVDVTAGIKQRFARLGIPTADVKIDVVSGTATLRGQLGNSSAIRNAQDEAMKVPGVRGVRSFLHLPGEPAPNKADALRAATT
jgi:hypothetical protein